MAIDLIEVIDCAAPHTAPVVAVGDLNPDRDLPYPDDAALFGLADERCLDVPDDPRFGVLPIVPTESTWNGRDGVGRAMPAGIYFCRLVTSCGMQTQKLTLVK